MILRLVDPAVRPIIHHLIPAHRRARALACLVGGCSRRISRSGISPLSTVCLGARGGETEEHLPFRFRPACGFRLTIRIRLYKNMLMHEALNLDAAFSALADPTRRALLARLARGEATVMELAKPFEMTQPAISQHLKVLEDAGLVVRRVDGTKRPRRLAKAGVEAMDQWLAMLRKALEKNYDRLDALLAGVEQPISRRGEKR